MTQCPSPRKPTKVSNQQCEAELMRESTISLRIVKLARGQKGAHHQGLRGSRSLVLRMYEVSDTNSTASVLIGMSSKKDAHSLPMEIV